MHNMTVNGGFFLIIMFFFFFFLGGGWGVIAHTGRPTADIFIWALLTSKIHVHVKFTELDNTLFQ